jgi:hypothetical protein
VAVVHSDEAAEYQHIVLLPIIRPGSEADMVPTANAEVLAFLSTTRAGASSAANLFYAVCPNLVSNDVGEF